jgi:hypothetical protein
MTGYGQRYAVHLGTSVVQGPQIAECRIVIAQIGDSQQIGQRRGLRSVHISRKRNEGDLVRHLRILFLLRSGGERSHIDNLVGLPENRPFIEFDAPLRPPEIASDIPQQRIPPVLNPSAIFYVPEKTRREDMGCLGIGCGNDDIIELVGDVGFPDLAQVWTREVQHVEMRMKPVPKKTGIPLSAFPGTRTICTWEASNSVSHCAQ